MTRAAYLATICLLWGVFAIAMYALADDNAVVAVLFLSIVVAVVSLGAVYALRVERGPAGPQLMPSLDAAPPESVPEPGSIAASPAGAMSAALGGYPLYLLARGEAPFSQWRAPGCEFSGDEEAVVRRAVWAYQLFVVSELASAHYGARAAERMRAGQLEGLRQDDPMLARACGWLFRVMRDHTGELEHASLEDAELAHRLEYYLAIDVLEDDPGSPYRVKADMREAGQPRPRSGGEFEGLEWQLARCLAYARVCALQVFEGFFSASRAFPPRPAANRLTEADGRPT